MAKKSMVNREVKRAKLPPRRLSFTQVWHTFDYFLLRQPPTDAATSARRCSSGTSWRK